MSPRAVAPSQRSGPDLPEMPESRQRSIEQVGWYNLLPPQILLILRIHQTCVQSARLACNGSRHSTICIRMYTKRQ